MKVFLAWSGEESKTIATQLRSWLQLVIQQLEPWMSEEDIGKGEIWNQALAEELRSAGFGILCLTTTNLTAPWIHFEAGALANAVPDEAATGTGRVSPFLVGVSKRKLKQPLSAFQLTDGTSKNDVHRLVRSLNALTSAPLAPALLDKSFETWWPDLEAEVVKLAAAPAPDAAAVVENPPTDGVLDELIGLVRDQQRRFDRVESQLERALAPPTTWPGLTLQPGRTYSIGAPLTEWVGGAEGGVWNTPFNARPLVTASDDESQTEVGVLLELSKHGLQVQRMERLGARLFGATVDDLGQLSPESRESLSEEWSSVGLTVELLDDSGTALSLGWIAGEPS